MNHGAIDRQSKAFFKGGEFTWQKSQADVWAEMEALVEAKPAGRSVKVNFRSTVIAIAASFLVLIGVGTFMRYYQVTEVCYAGEHQLAQLPDGSTIDMNAETVVKYNPYWWRFKREVRFEGEAFFEVEKGKKFSVVSTKGVTEVLGTSFNIFSREAIYKVTCVTGSVRVISPTKNTVVLKPNSKAEIRSNGTIDVKTDIETFPEISWKKNIFLFTAAPLQEVFYEIERQYNVDIKASIDSYALYTGNFSKDLKVEEVLSYVCPALGLEYVRKSDKEYEIIQLSE